MHDVPSRVQQCGDLVCGGIPEAHPNHFWRSTLEEAALEEIRIFGDDSEVAFLCVLPDRLVICLREASIPNMDGLRKGAEQPLQEMEGEILVEEEFHGDGAVNLRSRSAA